MTPQDTIVFLALMVCALAVFQFYGAGRYCCPFCGTKTGEHNESCIWRSRG
jgi:hypothetical protein